MSWHVDIENDKGLPNPQEPIVSICSSPGSLICLTKRVGFSERLVDFKTDEERIAALGTLIAAVDVSEESQGVTGLFTNEFALECDMTWSGGKESKAAWDEWADVIHKVNKHYPYRNYVEYTGRRFRERVRADAFRFWSYYKLGYTVKFTW